MFHRNSFIAKLPSSPRNSISLSPTTGPIPEDEPAPSAPIISSIQDKVPWNDTPASWASSAAAYDINSRYTTANNSYTHRRKSSLITGLMAKQNDPYQPRYQDWRNRTLDSPQGSFSLNFGVPKEQTGDFRSRKICKIFAGFLIVIVLALSGLWIFGGPLPLANLNGWIEPFRGTFAGNIWPACISRSNLDWKQYKNAVHMDWDVQRFISERLRPGPGSGDDNKAHNLATVSSVSTTTSMIRLNSDLFSFPPETISKVTMRASSATSLEPTDGDVMGREEVDKRSVIPTVVRRMHIAEDNVTAIGPPMQARSRTVQAGSSIDSTESNEEAGIRTGNPNHVEEMFIKHARVITPIMAETHETSSPRDDVPENTAVEGQGGESE